MLHLVHQQGYLIHIHDGFLYSPSITCPFVLRVDQSPTDTLSSWRLSTDSITDGSILQCTAQVT